MVWSIRKKREGAAALEEIECELNGDDIHTRGATDVEVECQRTQQDKTLLLQLDEKVERKRKEASEMEVECQRHVDGSTVLLQALNNTEKGKLPDRVSVCTKESFPLDDVANQSDTREDDAQRRRDSVIVREAFSSVTSGTSSGIADSTFASSSRDEGLSSDVSSIESFHVGDGTWESEAPSQDAPQEVCHCGCIGIRYAPSLEDDDRPTAAMDQDESYDSQSGNDDSQIDVSASLSANKDASKSGSMEELSRSETTFSDKEKDLQSTPAIATATISSNVSSPRCVDEENVPKSRDKLREVYRNRLINYEKLARASSKKEAESELLTLDEDEIVQALDSESRQVTETKSADAGTKDISTLHETPVRQTGLRKAATFYGRSDNPEIDTSSLHPYPKPMKRSVTTPTRTFQSTCVGDNNTEFRPSSSVCEPTSKVTSSTKDSKSLPRSRKSFVGRSLRRVATFGVGGNKQGTEASPLIDPRPEEKSTKISTCTEEAKGHDDIQCSESIVLDESSLELRSEASTRTDIMSTTTADDGTTIDTMLFSYSTEPTEYENEISSSATLDGKSALKPQVLHPPPIATAEKTVKKSRRSICHPNALPKGYYVI